MSNELPICDCGSFWPNQGHHPECPVRRRIADLEQQLAEVTELLAQLNAHVWAEAPQLLDEDSGGDSNLSLLIDAAIDRASEPSQSQGREP